MGSLPEYIRALLKLALGRGRRLSYGQFGEDAVIQAILKRKVGTYVDVGAYHPVLYSNTYALYQRGWHGIAIDPNPKMRELHNLLRPRDTFVQAAIGDEGIHTYHSFSDEAYNTLDDAEAQRRREMSNLTYKGATEMTVKPLSAILDERSIRQIDLLNIDVEGMDLQVLRSHDWSIRPDLIAVEVGGFDPSNPLLSDTYSYLLGKGYRLIAFSHLTLLWSPESTAK